MGRHRQFDEEEALEAALKVFWQKGYEGTSFDDLTQATGVARPGLYSTFGNKEEFFRKAMDLYSAKYVGFMIDALDEPTSFKVVARILNGCAKLHTMCSEHLGCLGLNGALACSGSNENIRQDLIERRTSTQSRLRRRLERARKEGDLPTSTDCAALSALVMAVTQGMAVQAKAGTSKKILDGMVNHFLATWPRPQTDFEAGR